MLSLSFSSGILALLAVTTSCVIPGCGSDSAAASSACEHNSDCDGGLVCLFAECAPVCLSDRDCAAGLRCLRTNDGAGCVSAATSKCTTSCPGGTTCGTDGECRTDCATTTGLMCLDGQACVGAECVGVDPAHDSGASMLSTGGGAGAAGSQSGGGSGVAGMSATAGASGVGGSSGAAGTSGTAGGGASGAAGSLGGSSGASGGSAASGASGASGAAGGGLTSSPACGDTTGFLEGALWPYYTQCTTHMTQTKTPGPLTSHVRWTASFGAAVGTITILPNGDLVVAAGDLVVVSASDGSLSTIATGSYSDVALGHGNRILAADGDTVHAFDATSHQDVWSQPCTPASMDAVSTILPFDGDHALVQTSMSTFATIDTTDGTIVETRTFGDTHLNFVTMNADHIAFIADTAMAHVFDPLSPGDLATVPLVGALAFGDYATASNGWFLYQTQGDQLVGIDATGATKLSATFCGGNDLGTNALGIAIAGACNGSDTTAYDVIHDSVGWTATGVGMIPFTPVSDVNGHVYGSTNSGVAIAIDVSGSTGTLLWSAQMSSPMTGLAALGPSVLYVANDHQIYAFGD